MIRDTPTDSFINLDSPGVPAPTATPALPEDDQHDEVPAGAGQAAPPTPKPAPPSAAFDPKADHVFISHGKQRAIVTQIKELLEFGKFTPVVSVEREATAISVPEKVFEDMRSCAAGIIHVGGEGKYLDPDGNEHTKLNDNVLIEIGAAMALYGKKIILYLGGVIEQLYLRCLFSMPARLKLPGSNRKVTFCSGEAPGICLH